MGDYQDDQTDELEALRAIFDEEMTEITSTPPCFMIKLVDMDIQLKGPIGLKITFPPSYPASVPRIEIPNRSKVLTLHQQGCLLEHLYKTASSNLNQAMVFTLVDSAKEWLIEHSAELCATEDGEELEEEIPSEDFSSLTQLTLVEPKSTGGKWDFVIGLVGKPSAGKSTFFNAATTLDQAKTGAHPFTTIEPNIGKAFYATPCPCAKLEKLCDAAYGHNFKQERHVPVLLKDVAGLVPGACDGKGRGNRFLNDLLDADVLIHIIDISGCTDEKGDPAVGYDPALDVAWLRNELQRWIFDNIMEKWDAIKKRPLKLVDMFSGYHANRAVIYAALQGAGIDSKELSNLPQWSESVVERIVASFLKVRFPMLLVLNKADLETAPENITRLQQQYPEHPVISVSAKSECQLQSLSKAGALQYEFGSSHFKVTGNLNSSTETELKIIQENVLNVYTSTNVQEALNRAVKLKQPQYAYPVHCLDTLQSLYTYRGKGEKTGVLKDCIVLKPKTTVEELFNVLLHYPLNLLNGDYVRAEAVDTDGKKRLVRKEDLINDTNCVLKIMTTRKAYPAVRH